MDYSKLVQSTAQTNKHLAGGHNQQTHAGIVVTAKLLPVADDIDEVQHASQEFFEEPRIHVYDKHTDKLYTATAERTHNYVASTIETGIVENRNLFGGTNARFVRMWTSSHESNTPKSMFIVGNNKDDIKTSVRKLVSLGMSTKMPIMSISNWSEGGDDYTSAEDVLKSVVSIVVKHLAGQHDQSKHAGQVRISSIGSNVYRLDKVTTDFFKTPRTYVLDKKDGSVYYTDDISLDDIDPVKTAILNYDKSSDKDGTRFVEAWTTIEYGELALSVDGDRADIKRMISKLIDHGLPLQTSSNLFTNMYEKMPAKNVLQAGEFKSTHSNLFVALLVKHLAGQHDQKRHNGGDVPQYTYRQRRAAEPLGKLYAKIKSLTTKIAALSAARDSGNLSIDGHKKLNTYIGLRHAAGQEIDEWKDYTNGGASDNCDDCEKDAPARLVNTESTWRGDVRFCRDCLRQEQGFTKEAIDDGRIPSDLDTAKQNIIERLSKKQYGENYKPAEKPMTGAEWLRVNDPSKVDRRRPARTTPVKRVGHRDDEDYLGGDWSKVGPKDD